MPATTSPAPGAVDAAATLAFLQAGFTALSALALYLLTHHGTGSVSSGARTHLIAMAATPVLGAVLLVCGGVLLQVGRSRVPVVLGCVVELLICVYYTDLLAGNSVGDLGAQVIVVVWSCYAPMPVAALIAAFWPSATEFLRARRISGPVAPPGPG